MLSAPDTPAAGTASFAAEHTRAVELGRAGRYTESFAIFEQLVAAHPGEYTLWRDYAIITAWKGECDAVVQRYRRAAPPESGYETYLVLPISDCLLDTGRPREALRLIDAALAKRPDEAALQRARTKAHIALKLDHNVDERATELATDLSFDESNDDAPQWLGQALVSTGVGGRLRLFGRYFFTMAMDDELEPGDQQRVGAGLTYRFNQQWRVSGELSTDVRDNDLGGVTTIVYFDPYDNLHFQAWHASYSLEMPLRARANGIYGSQTQLSVAYHTYDYLWSGYAATSYSDFADDNRRHSLYLTAGYAYVKDARREHRLFGEWYQSSNTEEGAPYFNPRRDYNLNLRHRTDFVHRSAYWRHVDRLEFYVGAYEQKDFGTDPVGGVQFEQDYDFDRRRNFIWRVGYRRAVYDGESANELTLGVHYRLRF